VEPLAGCLALGLGFQEQTEHSEYRFVGCRMGEGESRVSVELSTWSLSRESWAPSRSAPVSSSSLEKLGESHSPARIPVDLRRYAILFS